MADVQRNHGQQTNEGQHENFAQRHQRPRIALSQEELRVLKECNSESFWYRCVPFGVVFVGATQIMVNRGILKPNPRFGALFKNMGAALAAFVLGKMSYHGQCREKILRLENSALAESMRKGIQGVELVRDMTSVQDADGQTGDDLEVRQHYHKNEFSESKGFNNSLRPSLDREVSSFQHPEEHDSIRPGLSYDELRTRNRIEYEKKANDSKGSSMTRAPMEAPQQSRQPPSISSDHASDSWEYESSSTSKGARRNRYGDIME